mgnify:CR=1 FL=1
MAVRTGYVWYCKYSVRNLLSAIEFTGTKKAPSMGAGNKENYKQYLL